VETSMSEIYINLGKQFVEDGKQHSFVG